jgi:hypothetical protein
MADIQRVGLHKVILHFTALEDPRSTVNRQHPLGQCCRHCSAGGPGRRQWANSDRQVGGIKSGCKTRLFFRAPTQSSSAL